MHEILWKRGEIESKWEVNESMLNKKYDYCYNFVLDSVSSSEETSILNIIKSLIKNE